jgi:hypothetical protein
LPNFDRKELIRSFFTTLSKPDQINWLRHRNACDKSLFYFIKDIGGSMPMQGGDISEHIHKPVCDRLQDQSIKRQFFFMSRGWRKSTIGRWHWVWEYLRNPEIRILCASEKIKTASMWVKDTGLQLLRNERLRWLYPELQIINQRWTKTHPWSGEALELPRNGIYPEPTISVTGIRGASQGGHYDLITPDDLVGEKGYESTVVMEDAFRWFDNIEELLITSSTADPNGSRIAGRGTHWGVGDLGIYIQREYPEYKWYITPCLKHPNLEDTESVTWLQREDQPDGEVNWPEVKTTQEYIEKMNNPQKQAVFWSQDMNCPRDSTTLTKFDGAWLRFYKFETIGDDLFVVCEDDGQRFRVADFPLWGMIDPGGFAEMKLMKKGSRNAILIGGQPRDSVKKFVIETWAGRLKEPSKFLDKLFEMNDRRFVRGWMVETVGAQKYIFRDIQQEKKIRGKNLTILEMPSDVSKGAKDSDILGLLQPMQNGEIYVHRSMKELIAEIREYPSGLTVDLVDMLSKLNRHRWKRSSPGTLKSSVKPVVSGETGASSVTGYLALCIALLGPALLSL